MLRVPLPPQREHFLDLAAALLIYLEEGGAVARPLGGAHGEHETVAFIVERERYQQLARELRAARDPWVWRWFPRSGMSRRLR